MESIHVKKENILFTTLSLNFSNLTNGLLETNQKNILLTKEMLLVYIHLDLSLNLTFQLILLMQKSIYHFYLLTVVLMNKFTNF